MPTVQELLGYATTDQSAMVSTSRQAYLCPFSGRECTAGNRNLYVEVELHGQLEQKRPGICTIRAGADSWMVCPNRLFALDSVKPTEIRPYTGLSSAVRDVLEAIGATPYLSNRPIGVWAETRVNQTRGEKKFNYRFDFILNPVDRLSHASFADHWFANEASVSTGFARLSESADGYVPTRVPGWPIIVEVMTASTSGSNQANNTGIKPAFYNAWDASMGETPLLSIAPGPNARQVWGRMVSQLIAKSEAGEHWGGKTVWLMQDLLLTHLTETTQISRSKAVTDVPRPLPLKAANIVSYKFGKDPPEGATREIVLDRFIGDDIPSMFDELDEPTMHGILHAPFLPDPAILGLKLLQGQSQMPSLKMIILP